MAADATLFGAQRFVVVEKLTFGAPAELYLAEDRRLRRRLTLKLLHADRNYDASAARLLEREAKLLARIDHPNVVHLYDFGRFGAELCMALSKVGRLGLDEWLARGQPSHAKVLDVLGKAGHGLAAAHAAGVVHGALEPARIRVDERDEVALVDFDRAVDLAPEPGAWGCEAPGVDLDPDWTAPETRQSGRRDRLSDQYSFCAIAWETLAGRRAPSDPSHSATTLREFRREPAYRALARGLEPKPTDRWPSMDELLAALESKQGRFRGHRWWRAAF